MLKSTRLNSSINVSQRCAAIEPNIGLVSKMVRITPAPIRVTNNRMLSGAMGSTDWPRENLSTRLKLIARTVAVIAEAMINKLALNKVILMSTLVNPNWLNHSQLV